jgi:hypothetical protein
MTERTFTPEDANALLPVVRPLVEQMVAARQRLLRAQERQAELAGYVSSNGGALARGDAAEVQKAVDAAMSELAEAVRAIQKLGLQVKDLDTGLVDFPAVHRGVPILLCWRLGEDEVGYWHGLEDGFAGRRPLPLD